MVNTTGLSKAAVLAALYNASKPQGMGFMKYNPAPMTEEQAETILTDGNTYFDYLKGRVMKLDLSKDDKFDPWGYDRDNGLGAAQKAIDALRATNNTNSLDHQKSHRNATLAATEEIEDILEEGSPSGFQEDGSLRLGLDDVADHLRPAVERAKERLG